MNTPVRRDVVLHDDGPEDPGDGRVPPKGRDRGRPLPSLVRPSFTPDQETTLSQRAVEMAQAGLVRSPDEQERFKARGHDQDDLQGLPCACGTSRQEMCLVHYKIQGHRRHVRPSGQYQGRDRHRDPKPVNDRPGRRPRF